MYAFLITFLAGISTVLGIIPTYFNSKYKDNIINISLSFACGIMISISLFSLIPESINYIGFSFINVILLLIFINIGLIISTYIDKKITKKIDNNYLYKLGLVSIIALILHNIPEGITTFLTTSSNFRIGLTLSLAIALHNIPEGISIAVPIYYSTGSHKKAFIYTFISGFSELIGGILSYIFLSKFINNFILSIILGVTSGIMIQISLFELLPNSLKYKNYFNTFIGFILGFIIMIICVFIFNI
ncbi:MAG: ZIP family metal transporter [Bacilli bacterium]|nr:ZIP family metal transporter [Bacilli bacterium]